MSLFISSINSGSNGNCYYVGNQDEAILVDGGLSCKETEIRMRRNALSIKKVKGIFISHEHGDHIYGVAAISKKHKIPVYITEETLRNTRLGLKSHLIIPFKSYDSISIGNLTVTSFPKLHDASDPHSFIVSSQSVKVGIFTDIGLPCDHVIRHFEKCHAAFLESNYDEDMLNNGSYPIYLKNRIKDGKGHLSNKQAVELFINHKPSFMSHLFLSHLSRENNSPRIVKDLFNKIAGNTRIIIASRDKESLVYHIRNIPAPVQRRIRTSAVSRFQLSLF